jgi:DNA-binding transcriptional MerR regulator
MEDGWRLRIGELAELAGVTTRTLRHYERVGVLDPPERARNGYRTYPPSALVDVLEIRRLQHTGLSLQQAAAVRADRAAGRASSTLDRLADAEADLDAQIARLRARRSALRELREGLAEGEAVLARRQGNERAGGFESIGHRLRELGVSERAIAEQRRAWSALRNVQLPADWQALLDAGATDLERVREIDGLAEVLDLVAALRDVEPHDPLVETVAGRLVAVARAAPSARAAAELATSGAVPILAVVASCFSDAQVAALLYAMQKLDAAP